MVMSDQPEAPVKSSPPVVTCLLAAGCALTYAFQITTGYDQGMDFAYPGYVDDIDLWSGCYWGLLNSFFLHGSFVHLIFNVCWLIPFGIALEKHLGWFHFLLFWILTTAFSSLVQAYACGSTGIGASGFVYGLFGCLWVAGLHHPALAVVLTPWTKFLFIASMVGCYMATSSGLTDIANAAHLGGLVWGALYGYVFLVQSYPIWRKCLVAATLLAFLPLFYAPWSEYWNLAQGIKALHQLRYASALTYLDRVRLPFYEDYVLQCRIIALDKEGRSADAAKMYRCLFAKEPKLADPAYSYNGYAWLLATTEDKEISAGREQEAIRYATLACDAESPPDSNYLDTLAAAYANAGQFDEAIKSQQEAITRATTGIDEFKAHLQLYEEKKPLRITPKKSESTSPTANTSL